MADESSKKEDEMWQKFYAVARKHVMHEELVEKHKRKLFDSPEYTPFYFAVEENNVDEVKKFIEKGFDVNAQGDYYDSPLFYAAANGVDGTAKLLLENGADVDILTNDGDTPLHAACREGHKTMVEILLEHGACIEYMDEEGQSPLIIASQANQPEIVKLLLQKGAKRNVTDYSWGKTAFMIAAEKGFNAVMDEFLALKKFDLDYQCNQCFSALHGAVKGGNVKAVELLISKGANINIVSNLDPQLDRSCTPLHLAIAQISELFCGRDDDSRRKSYEIALMLLELGANVNIAVKDGCTPLHIVAQAADDYKQSLMYSTLIKKLLEKGALIDAQDKKGNTALHCAVKSCSYVETVKLLIECGAKMDIKNVDNKTPIDLLGEDVYERLKQNQKDIKKLFHVSA